MKHAISWFEIPTEDIERAQKFYEAIFHIEMMPMRLSDFEMRIFPIEDQMNNISGALVKTAPGFYQPSNSAGVLIYLNGNPDLQIILDRVETAGGKILLPKTQISEQHGSMALFQDTEGNRLGLHCIQ